MKLNFQFWRAIPPVFSSDEPLVRDYDSVKIYQYLIFSMPIFYHSAQYSSLADLLLDESVESVGADGLCTVASNGVDQVLELFVRIVVAQLFADISHVVHVELALALHVDQGESSSSTFLAEGVSLNHIFVTILEVRALKKPSKSRASDPESWQTSSSALKTISCLESRPRVLAVIKMSRMSALR